MLINCPHCGEQISDTAENCVHCGCKITVCPDCGHAAAGDVDVCGKCGCRIKSDTNSESAMLKQESSNLENTYDNWAKSAPRDNAILKKIKLIEKLVDIVGTMFLIIAVVVYFVWHNGNEIEKLTSYKSTLSAFRWLSIAGLIIMMFPTENTIECTLTLRLVGWIRREKFDVKNNINIIGNTEVIGDSQVAKFSELLLDAAFMYDNGSKSRYCAKYIIRYAIFILFYIASSIFLFKTENALMVFDAFDMPFVFDYTWLIVAGAALTVYIILAFVDPAGFDKRQKKWMKSFES